MTSLEFKRGGFYTEGDKTTNIFKDPMFGLRNLLECIFSGNGLTMFRNKRPLSLKIHGGLTKSEQFYLST